MIARLALTVALLAVAVVATQAQAEATKTAAIRVIVVQRTGSVSPGATSPVSVLCPRTYTAISWGFQAITPSQGKWLALRYVSASPIVRKNGGLVGWIVKFENTNAVPLGVRVAATCAEGRGVTIRTAGSRAPSSSSADGEVSLRFMRARAEVEPGEIRLLRAFCPPGTIYVTWGHDLSVSTLLDDRPLVGNPIGWEMEVVNNNPSVTATVSLFIVCAEGRGGVKLGMTDGSTSRPGTVVLDVSFTHTLAVPTSGTSYWVECLKGVNVGIGYSIPETLSTAPPLLGTWFHRPVSAGVDTLNPKARTIALLGGGAGAGVQLQASCLKGNRGFRVPKPGVVDLLLSY